MSYYRRLYIPGGTCFFTVNLATRGTSTLSDEVDLLRDVYAAVVREHPVVTHAIVILPDHLHAVWTLPEGDDDFSVRWKKIKAGFSRHCLATAEVSPSRARKGEKGIWQRRFWEHAIRDEADFRAHVEYCWNNPVKHGLVERPEDWPYSSVHRDRRVGETHAAGREGGRGERRVGCTHPTVKRYFFFDSASNINIASLSIDICSLAKS